MWLTKHKKIILNESIVVQSVFLIQMCDLWINTLFVKHANSQKNSRQNFSHTSKLCEMTFYKILIIIALLQFSESVF